MKRAVVKLPRHGSGFYSNYFAALSMVEEADRRGLYPYVDLTNTAFVPHYNPYNDLEPPSNAVNPWDWWFIQPPVTDDDSLVFIEEEYSYNLDQTRNIANYGRLSNYRAIASKYFTIRQDILDETEDYYRGVIGGHTTLGVMARGAEMNRVHPLYGDHDIKIWVKEVKKLLNRHKEISRIFLVTEETEYLNHFRAEFDNVYFLDNVFRRTTEQLDYMVRYPLWPCLHKGRDKHTEKLGRESLIQALLLSRCEYLLGKQCGTVSAAVFFSRGFKKFYFSDTNPLVNRNLTLVERLRFFAKRSILRVR